MNLDNIAEKLAIIGEEKTLKNMSRIYQQGFIGQETILDSVTNKFGDEWPMRYIDGNRSHDPFKDIKLPKKSLFEEKRAIALKAYENNQ